MVDAGPPVASYSCSYLFSVMMDPLDDHKFVDDDDNDNVNFSLDTND